ncbi:unnamed protein product, partial [Symbiodinium sp. KB8]
MSDCWPPLREPDLACGFEEPSSDSFQSFDSFESSTPVLRERLLRSRNEGNTLTAAPAMSDCWPILAKESTAQRFEEPSSDSFQSFDSFESSTPVLRERLLRSRNEAGASVRQHRIEQMAHIVAFLRSSCLHVLFPSLLKGGKYLDDSAGFEGLEAVKPGDEAWKFVTAGGSLVDAASLRPLRNKGHEKNRIEMTSVLDLEEKLAKNIGKEWKQFGMGSAGWSRDHSFSRSPWKEDAGSLQKRPLSSATELKNWEGRARQAEEDVTCDYSGCFPLLDARKKLWSSDKMLVHMFAGEREKKELTFLEGVDRRPPPHWLSRRLAARPCSFEPDAPRKSRIYARPALLSPAHGIISLRCTSRASLTDAGRCPLLLRVAPCKGALDLRCSAPGSFCHVLDWTPTADLRNWEGPGEPALGAVLRAGQRPGPLRRGGCAGVDMIGEWKCVKVEHITMPQ